MPDPFDGLRDALRVSPDNVPLRAHLAAELLRARRAPEAEAEYRRALALSPRDASLQLGLSEAFLAQGKTGEAVVALESLAAQPGRPARALLVWAKALHAEGEDAEAARRYRAAVSEDPDLADDAFADRLGFQSQASGDDEDDDGPAFIMGGRMRGTTHDPDEPLAPEPEHSDVTFEDVGGMENLKEEIRLKLIYPMQQPDLYRAYGKKPGGGLLLYGPPGCGKTHLARATAGEVDAAFLSIGLHDVLDMWIGQSEKRLHGIFEVARDQQPCVLFFDEVDALGASRSDLRQSGGRHVVNQFLAELDGVGTDNEGVLVLAATNAPWHLDPAFRRPGRFDRIVFVPPPDREGRAEILGLLTREIPQRDLDLSAVAKKTAEFSGADLQAVVDTAVEAKLHSALRTGTPEPLTTKDLLTAAKTRQPSTTDWFATARNHALYANESGLYDDVLAYLKRR
ncbi:ATP-binding protein [Rubricoccus marinus]|uniref:Cell division protein n=1 Tax=Rubricoccus marinus TaxID=716817 RepID=A0A259U2G5_9BACT|nr:ATP-binding protein [Rubricoccus marinus]OZC04140.1 cell division protein [Rubricoccus marinus]